MDCRDCYWCKLNNALSEEKVCCNEKSPHYNQKILKEKLDGNGCEFGETKQAVAYRNMTAWEFASRYYM